ncbi:cysteine desulfurase family protein [Sphingomonas koreensis]
MNDLIYLDHHAHTPIDPRVLAAMVECLQTVDGNPHATNLHGERAHRAIEQARAQVAGLLGAQHGEIIFTSGATESNNLALRGVLAHLGRTGRTRILVSAGEHASVLETVRALAAEGAIDLAFVPLRGNGLVDLDALTALLDDRVGLVSIMAANHEIGTLQPIAEIAKEVRAAGAYFHSDLAQALGKVSVPIEALDLASFSGHKLYGPAGIGGLFVRRSLRRFLRPILTGGGQEVGLRSGTLPLPLCVGLGEACAIADAEFALGQIRVATLRDRLLARLEGAGGRLNGCPRHRLAGNINIAFDGVDGEALLLAVRDRVSISTGSACSSAGVEPSHVLLAIGQTPEQAERAIRIGLGLTTREADVDAAADAILEGVAVLRGTGARRVA